MSCNLKLKENNKIVKQNTKKVEDTQNLGGITTKTIETSHDQQMDEWKTKKN